AERATYRAPASIATPVANLSNHIDAPVVGPTPAPTPTANPVTNNELEQRRKLEDLERQMKELERREAELAAEGRRAEVERMRAEIERLKRERDALNNFNNGNNNVVKVTPTPGPTPRPIPTATPVVGDNTGGNQRVGGGGTMPVAGPNKRTLPGPGGAASGGSSSGKTRNLASNGQNGLGASLDGFAGKYAKNSRFRAPIEPYEGKPGGLPGIKALKHHLPYESPWILPDELIKLFGIKKVVMYFQLEGKTFSALEVLGPSEYQIIVYAFNPRQISKAEIETPAEIDRRLRVKRLLEEMRATPEEAEKNAKAFSTAAGNTHELAREILLTERDRQTAKDQLLSQTILDKAWEELRHFEVPPEETEEE
ncbi:MAG: hypothetical protein HYV97_15205, partial [Bdellovibrio sp.]|nr:hypothetical protein [Bdellovibrio sp.]